MEWGTEKERVGRESTNEKNKDKEVEKREETVNTTVFTKNLIQRVKIIYYSISLVSSAINHEVISFFKLCYLF